MLYLLFLMHNSLLHNKL